MTILDVPSQPSTYGRAPPLGRIEVCKIFVKEYWVTKATSALFSSEKLLMHIRQINAKIAGH